jgi:cation-transporting ATPase E
MSGSFVDSGSLVAKVVRVGAESYAARINSEAKYIKKVNSEIMGTLNMIIRFATYLLGPLGVGLYLRTIATGSVTTDAVLTTVAALVGMIPQGLVLLTSTVLAIATIRLARSKVLVQQLYCIETLARVDVLCLDKTGTITSGHMEVQKVVDSALGDDDAADVETSISTIAHGLASDANETSNAILTYVDGRGVKPLPVARTIPFSSARKYSGCVCSNGRALVMGAAQFVLGEGSGAVGDSLRTLGERTRVLVVCEADGFDDDLAIKGEARLLGFVAIQDEIRRSASDTISFFKKQGVDLKIISGDDPVTVSAIASKVGVPHAERYVDASELDTPGKLFDAVSRYSVFGRVTPAQKRELVKAIKSQGHTVAMTGDGVNDVLALKEADCSVAMASGSDAARNVAEIVLVDNDFAHMPEVVAEGRRSINNLQRSASLFLVKTVFSAALALVCIVNPPYPFLPIQMSLISASIIGIPSFVLALEPNHERVTGNFLGNVLARSLPASVVISVVVGLATCTSGVMGLDFGQTSTLCTLLTALIGLALIARISRPMNPLRLALLFVSAGTVLIGCTLLKGLFEVSELNLQMWVFLVVAGGLGLIVFNLLYDRGTAAVCDEGGYSRFMRSLEEKHGRNRS